MRGGKRERIEKAVDIGAATALAAAVAFSLYKLLPGTVSRPYFNLVDACLGLVAFLLSFRSLRGLGSKAPDFELRLFELPQLSFDEPDELLLTQQVELLLTDADRVKPPRSTEEELVLNDILAEARSAIARGAAVRPSCNADTRSAQRPDRAASSGVYSAILPGRRVGSSLSGAERVAPVASLVIRRPTRPRS